MIVLKQFNAVCSREKQKSYNSQQDNQLYILPDNNLVHMEKTMFPGYFRWHSKTPPFHSINSRWPSAAGSG